MRLQKAPLVTSGLVLGLLGLGNLLKDLSLTLNAICGIFAFLIWIHLLCTMLKYFNNVKEQLNSPLVSSVFTTFFMSGFLGTTYLNTFFSNITFINNLITPIWILCLVGIMMHMIIFSIKYLKDFHLRMFILHGLYFYWYCYRRIDGTRQRIFFHRSINSNIWLCSYLYCLTYSFQAIKSISIADVNQTEHIDNLCTIFFSRCSICYSLS
ncbi:putative permease [Staphylococcus aureus]|uniref:Putative permease n=1 Tax=Staphylococcus aureus TaxID=1280 RepID=A0A2X2K288_STAAU|nr:putative permease [Staphylococcus aureus]